MADIIDITNKTKNEYGSGLNTRLVFDGGVEIGEEKSFNIRIDTCIVPGNEENPYEILVSSDNVTNVSLFNQRCGRDEYLNVHFGIVDRLKKSYLEK